MNDTLHEKAARPQVDKVWRPDNPARDGHASFACVDAAALDQPPKLGLGIGARFIKSPGALALVVAGLAVIGQVRSMAKARNSSPRWGEAISAVTGGHPEEINGL